LGYLQLQKQEGEGQQYFFHPPLLLLFMDPVPTCESSFFHGINSCTTRYFISSNKRSVKKMSRDLRVIPVVLALLVPGEQVVHGQVHVQVRPLQLPDNEVAGPALW
jgi:hypothetical protein